MSLQIVVPVEEQPDCVSNVVKLHTEPIGLRIVFDNSGRDNEETLNPDLLITKHSGSWVLFLHVDGDHKLSIELGNAESPGLQVENEAGDLVWSGATTRSNPPEEPDSAKDKKETTESDGRRPAVDFCPKCRSREILVTRDYVAPSAIAGIAGSVDQVCTDCRARWLLTLVPVSYQMFKWNSDSALTGKIFKLGGAITELTDLARTAADLVPNRQIGISLHAAIKRVVELQTNS